MFDYTGKVVALTGASSGLGRQMAEGFAKQGADLVLLARRVERLEATAKDFTEKYDIKVLPVACDVTSTESINAAVAKVEETFGHCEVIINCAGGEKGTGTPFEQFKKEDIEFTIRLDAISVYEVSQAFVNLMERAMEAGKQSYGRIINIASIYGLVGNTAIPTTAYHLSKHAVVGITRANAAELATKKITCNCICPGYFYTELTTDTLNTEYFQNFAKQSVPMQRYGSEGELNAAAVFLGAEESSYVTGQIIAVDGGYTCV